MVKISQPIKLLSLSVFFLSCPLFSFSSPEFSSLEFASKNVKTIWFEKEDLKTAYPFLQPGSGEQLALSFDIIEGDGATLWYNIVHCDRDWNRSDLFTSDYMEGFEENQVTDFAPSFNTRINYIHYRISLPNEDVRFLVSGNYVITLWSADNPGEPLLVRRFYISEGTSSASVIFRRPMKPGTTETHQQAEITIATGSLPVTDPYRQVTLTIMQNGRPDRMKSGLTPDFVSAGRLEYNTLSDKTLMPGGNEFRFFDIKTIRQTRQNVKAIDFVNGVYHAYLIPSDDREFKPYFFNEDFNGRFVVAIEESREPEREADYVWVWFTMPAYQELRGGSLYVTGSFCGWQNNAASRMTWSAVRGCYEASVLLKQGWYNYEYAWVPNGSAAAEGYHFEGSHWDTENDYLVLTYFRDPTARYDRLTGITLANTRAGSRQ
ncbi:MAG: DUF5103 domain-containing protein [Bacteroidales bacterium]|jgi:hypothetical protein|nr:DUF5103 domain-containing protein [Bacteroidales bacterium]